MISYDGDVLSPYESVLMRKFRPEIQLLRAIAVLAVVVYHIQPSWLPGGFVGVDVFFVISGYLITAHMLKEVESTGRLSLSQFWANRARRILPAATLAIVVTTIASLMFLPVTQLDTVTKQAVASAVYVQNFALAAQSVDYLGQGEAATPFQHFWSLSVEEQFYVVWPLLVVLALWATRRLQNRGRHSVDVFRRRFRLIAFVLFAVVCLVSFVWSVVSVGAGDPAAYFITPTRVWELGIGGLLACVLGDPQKLNSARKAMAIVGVVAIGVACVTYTGEVPAFPGASALLPTVATVAVIAAGWTTGLGSLRPIINWKPVQLVGLWSYSLYLWHFPVVVFFRERNGRPAEGVTEFVALFAVSLALAMLSFYYVEQPLRVLPFLKNSNRRALIAAGVAVAVTVAVGVTPVAKQQAVMALEQKATEQLRNDLDATIGRASLRQNSYDAFVPGYENVLIPPITEIKDDTPEYPCSERIPAKSTSATTAECIVANPDGKKTLAVVGDSHASQWVPALQKIVEGTEWRLVVYLHDSCPFSLEPRGNENKNHIECTEPNRKTLDTLVKSKPDRVITTNLNVKDFEKVDGEKHAGTSGFIKAWKPLVKAGIPITVLHDTPDFGDNEVIPDCVALHMEKDDLEKCGRKREDVQENRRTNAALKAASDKFDNVDFVNLTDLFCTESECPAVIGNVIVYRDKNHVSANYMETVADDLDKALELRP